MVFPACTLLMIDIEQELHVWMVHLAGQLESIDTTIQGKFLPIHERVERLESQDQSGLGGQHDSHQSSTGIFHCAIGDRSSHRLEWNQRSGEDESASI